MPVVEREQISFNASRDPSKSKICSFYRSSEMFTFIYLCHNVYTNMLANTAGTVQFKQNPFPMKPCPELTSYLGRVGYTDM